MHDNFLERIKNNKKKVVASLIALTTVILLIWKIAQPVIFVHKAEVIVKQANFEESYNNIIQQADNNDWIKKDEYSSFEQMLFLKTMSETSSQACIDLIGEILDQKGFSGEFKHNMEEAKSIYVLKGSNAENKTEIRLNVDKNEDLTFYKEEQQLSFDLSEKALKEKQDYSLGQSYIEKLVLAYTDEPEIATIHNGRITAGKKKGTTNLNVYKDGLLFSYKVTVQ